MVQLSTLDRWWLSAWIFPVISACMWLGMLLAMFISWEVQGSPHYPSMSPGQHIAYISDVGAFRLKPLFITGSAVTTAFLDLAFLSERWLRHYGRLAPNTSRTQSILSSASIFWAFAGTAGLVILSIFDTYHHDRIHDGCLLLFLGGYIISAILLCIEYQRLGIHYRQHRVLRISFWVKLVFIIVEVILAIVFASTFSRKQNVAAGFEWIIALIFTFYVLSFLLDLWPSVKSKHHTPQGWREDEAARLEKDAERNGGLTSFNDPPAVNGPAVGQVDGAYRGTNMTNGQRSDLPAQQYPAGHNDLGRQKKRGLGSLPFYDRVVR